MVDRLAVIGNCQAAPLANCLRMANPGLHVSVTQAAGRVNPDRRKQVMEKLHSADVILVVLQLDLACLRIVARTAPSRTNISSRPGDGTCR